MRDEIQELMRRAAELPYGEARTVLVEEALRRAESISERALAFQVRMELTTAYQYSGEKAKSFTTFSRCLSDYDREPGAFDEYAGLHLLWQFKWTVNSLLKFPDVPLERTRQVLDDMERRYKAGGHSLHAVYSLRNAVACHLGDTEDADHWYTRWHAAPRDQLSDCIGCEPGAKLAHLSWRGRDDDALAIAEPVLRAELNCNEQPQGILTGVIPIYLRAGRLAEARDAHRRAYRVHRTRLSDLSEIADHLEFLARSGNEARALEILERHLEWLDRAPTPASAMQFSAAAALVLRRLAETGHAHLDVRRGPAEVPLETLRNELTAQALDLAARFDARNGTSEQSTRVTARLAAEPLTDHLPLTPHSPQPRPRPAAPTPPPPLTEDLTELLELGWKAWRGQQVETAFAAWHRYDALATAPTPWQTARRTDALGVERWYEGDLAAALAQWELAEADYAEADDVELSKVAMSNRGATLVQIGRPDEGIPLMESALEWLDGHAVERHRALAARLKLAAALTRTDSAPAALALVDSVDLTEGVEPVLLADVAAERGRALIALDRHPEAIESLREACRVYRLAEQRMQLAGTALLLAQLLAHAGDDEADAVYDEVVTNATDRFPMVGLTGHRLRGELLLRRGECAKAAEDLIEAVAGLTALGEYAQAAYARADLSEAYLRTDRFLEAAEAAEEAIPAFGGLSDTDSAMRCRFLLANAQRELGEDEASAETFTELADALREEHPGRAAEHYANAGQLLTKLDKDALAADRFCVAAEMAHEAGDLLGSQRLRRQQALCQLWSGPADRALETMSTARAVLAEVVFDTLQAKDFETAIVDYDESRILAGLGRTSDALANVERAIATFRALNSPQALVAAENLRSQLTETR